jgi:Uma2 family endonuclease
MTERLATLSPPAVNNALLQTHPALAVVTIELPDSDGEPMDNERAGFQMQLVLDSLAHHWRARQDFYSGGNMFVYYSVAQARQVIAELAAEGTADAPPDLRPRRAFRGPDAFVVLNVDGSYRRQKWVVWEEGGRYPDIIFEFLSTSTARSDQTTKKTLYEQVFRTPEYYWYDPFDPTVLRGWRLGISGRYDPMTPNAQGWLWSPGMQLWVGRWEGTYKGDAATWVRLYDPQGNLVHTPEESAEQQAAIAQQQAATAQQQAATAQQQAEAERLRAEAERQRADAAEAELARLRAAMVQRYGEQH